MQALYTIYEIVAMLTNVLVMLIIIQFIIGLLFAFNVVNSSNEFNVPFCDYKNPAIFDEENLRKTSELLNSIDVEFKEQDYQLAMRDCNKDDFCYLDPPYHAEKKTSFTSYTKDSFGAHDQINIFKWIQDCTSGQPIKASSIWLNTDFAPC